MVPDVYGDCDVSIVLSVSMVSLVPVVSVVLVEYARVYGPLNVLTSINFCTCLLKVY